MNKREKDTHFAAHVPGVLQYHQNMLSDGVRNALLYEAIKRHVNEDTNFLDIGAGTGVWAILAAKLGAKRVVAIEIEECLIPIIYKHAQENGVADRIEIIHGNSNDVKLRGKFDVIVSELFGQDALGKSTIDSFVNLRNRFLAPGGVLIPQALANYAVPVHSERSVGSMPAELPISCEYLKSLKLNYPQNIMMSDRPKLTFLSEPVLLLELDFTNIFTDDLRIDNFSSQSWGTTLYEFEPFQEKAGTLKFDLTMDEQKSIWSVSVPTNNDLKPKSQSPAFAIARIRMTQQMTPHRKVRASKKQATDRV